MWVTKILHLTLFFTCWMICTIQTYADVHFIENGFEYSSLIPGQCGQFCVKDTTDAVMLKGYVSPYSFDSRQPLHIPASVVHNGKTYKVKEIGENALFGLPSVESIIFDEGIVKIDAYAICHCTNLKSVYIPASVNNIHNSLFLYCPNLTEIVVNPDNENYDSRDHCNAIIYDDELIVGCNGTKIPDSVKEIGEYAFLCRNGLEEIIIPEGVISIGLCAFANCGSLRRVSLPSSLEEIKLDAFASCTSLDSIFIPKQVNNIYDNIFSGCTRLSSIVVDKENKYYDSRLDCNGIIRTKDSTLIAACKATRLVESIKDLYAGFDGVTIHTIRIPKSVKHISGGDFSGCKEIDNISVDPENPKYISPEGSNAILTKDGKELVLGCRTTIIPAGVEEINSEAFNGRCTDIALTLPEGIKTIDYAAFANNKSICTVTIPSTVTDIDIHAFSNCENLQAVQFLAPIEEIFPYTFCNCKNLSIINIPEGVKAIDTKAFEGCTNLKNIHLPSTLEEIEEGAFEGCPCEESVKRFIKQKK